MSKRELDIHLYRFSRQVQALSDQVDSLESHVANRVTQMRKTIMNLRAMEDQLSQAADSYKEAATREVRKPLRELEKEIELLKKAGGPPASPALSLEGLEKAKTIAIFDAMLFAIENWSNDGQIAEDITIASQSILFPTVYERVMSGNNDYLIETVPVAAIEVVKRGREFVRHIRNTSETSLLEPSAWEEHAELVQKWWITDALPLIYGARDPQWDEDAPLSQGAALEWREQPASRALHFPLIFDGMELVKKFGDQIRESTGLPDFTKTTITTRIDPNE